MEMNPVISSAIDAIGYDAEKLQMAIKFKQGDAYIFCRVPEAIYLRLMSAGSKGRFYDNFIKDRYKC
jgi:hypothetical protein